MQDRFVIFLPDYSLDTVATVMKLLYTGCTLVPTSSKSTSLQLIKDLLHDLQISSSLQTNHKEKDRSFEVKPASAEELKERNLIRRYVLDPDSDDEDDEGFFMSSSHGDSPAPNLSSAGTTPNNSSKYQVSFNK